MSASRVPSGAGPSSGSRWKPASRTASASASAGGGLNGPSSSWSSQANMSGRSTGSPDLWTKILQSASRQKSHGRKHILLLSEKHHGRRYLLERLLSASDGPSGSTSSANVSGSKRKMKGRQPSGSSRTLAMGYEVMQVGEDGDEDSVPPVSIFYPSSSHTAMTGLVPATLPPRSLQDTAVVIVLDWSRPANMMKELVTWLKWVQKWAESAAEQGQAEEMRERLQSFLQHYTEPPAAAGSAAGPKAAGGTATQTTAFSTYSSTGPLLPLGPGTLTLNSAGIPITVVCTKADLMDAAGEDAGMKGAQWEERTDWVQQALRTVCLQHGAALFYTAPTAGTTYDMLRGYLLHRLYTVPPPLIGSSTTDSSLGPPASSTSRFPFPYRANVLDRDAVMVPSGWDSWGKINVLRDGFDPKEVGRLWEEALDSEPGEPVGSLALERLWAEMVPVLDKALKAGGGGSGATTVEPEQAFLARHLETLLKDPNRDPRQSFRSAIASASAASAATSGPSGDSAAGADSKFATYGGVVGPMGQGGLSLPGVEKVMAEMEGGATEDIKEKFARLSRRESTRATNAPGTPSATSSASTVPNEALHNFFQGLLAKSSTPASGASSKTAASAASAERK